MEELGVEVATHLGCPRCFAVYLQRFQVCALDGTPLVEMNDDPLIGKIIAGRYLVEAFVGEGGMGRVYRARHTALSRRFAIKILFGEYAAEKKARARFAREAEAASRLDHPNVVSVIDYGETETKLPYLAMDFVEGRDLLHILDRERRLPLPRVLRLAKDMCRGLAHAHARGLVHRDFKPGNVLVVTDDSGREIPRIADFGLAIDPGELSSRLTTGRIIFGSPAYMSPEQASQGELDARSDQFSLGVTLFELVTGRLPFSGSAVDQLTKNASAPRPTLASTDPTLRVPKSYEKLVQKLMSIWPNGRYSSMDAVCAELERIEAEVNGASEIITERTRRLEPAEARVSGGAAGPAAALFAAGAAAAATPAPAPASAPAPLPTTTAPQPAEAPEAPEAPGPDEIVDERKVPTHLVSRQVGEGGADAQRERRRRFLVGLVVVALLGLGVGGIVGLRGRGKSVAPRIDVSGVALGVDAGAKLPAVPLAPDAAPVIAAAEPDAAVATPNKPPAVPTRPTKPKKPDRATVAEKKPPVVVTEKPPQPPVVTEKPPVDTPPPSGEITAKGFTDYYKQVGSALEKLRQTKGEDAAAPFRARYFAIPLNDALRTPALRTDAMKKLSALEHDIRAALR